jgi:CRISPR-associated protein Cmr3
MTALELRPVDTLFFRDARPMEAGAGSGGHGASWPLPTVVYSALRMALLRKAGQIQRKRQDKGHHRYDRVTKKQINNSLIFTEAFRSLRTIGPFPCCDGKVFLPRPLDLVPSGDDGCALLQPVAGQYGVSNLPVTWLHPVTAPGRAGKRELPGWISLEDFRRTLAGEVPSKLAGLKVAEVEHRVGIMLDDTRGATVEGKLYTAEHLRLGEGVGLWIEVCLSDRAAGKENHHLNVEALLDSVLPLGGEGRMVRCKESAAKLEVPRPVGGRLVKWVLATHAVFVGGWRPNWVDEATGRVLLKSGDTARSAEDRRSWRERVRKLPPIGAKLVAACIANPLHFSGWDLGEQGPKPTLVAVPAGSVYYFQADTEDDARALVEALHGRTRSDYFGEKGMGLGYCGVWQPVDVAGRPVAGGSTGY